MFRAHLQQVYVVIAYILPGHLNEIGGLNTNQMYGLQSPRGQEVFFLKLRTNRLCLQTGGGPGPFSDKKKEPQRDSHILNTEIQNA